MFTILFWFRQPHLHVLVSVVPVTDGRRKCELVENRGTQAAPHSRAVQPSVSEAAMSLMLDRSLYTNFGTLCGRTLWFVMWNTM